MSSTKIQPDIEKLRKAQYDIDPLFINRWSPRSFKADKEVPEDVLLSIFEAARWAPSALNIQPWKFILARTKKDREKFNSFIMEGNRIWCEKAPVLALIISKKTNDKIGDNATHAFDTGAAWGYLSLQASQKGLITHPMGGFDREKAREVLNIPEDYAIHAVVAIGYQGEKEALPEKLQEREQPSDRRPLQESIHEGTFQP
ncbi:nitroreductase family protein [Sediminibacillus albus]|uniref:Nitroreductase n=1 Tax=Sediminibacillus albus TaxID=407036 RepID=A0A1G8Y9L0_9BACI|nr:nitroreductase family protein [Sediminibacillus albus]SDJ99569.1 Nitroreductase [Sediminibacillus albus]